MTHQVRNFLCGLLALWVLLLVGLMYVVLRDLHAPASVLIGIFQKADTAPPKTALVSEPTVPPAPKPAVAPNEPKKVSTQDPLLPQGRKAGKAFLNRGSLQKTNTGYVFTVPYKGNIYNYTTYTLAKKKARIIDIQGKIRCDYHMLTFDKTWDISMIQMAMHQGYARISVIGKGKTRSFTQKIHYTPQNLKIYLSPVQ